MSEPLRSGEGYRDGTEPYKNSTELGSVEGQMVINPQGARIEKLRLGGRVVFKSVVRGDGKEVSSHPCTPIFGPPDETNIYGLTQHGPMRNELCTVKESGSNLVILDHDIKVGSYPEGLNVRQTFSMFGNNFTLETVHKNNGEQDAPVNFGEHFYWAAPNGWEGLTINGNDVTDAVKNDLVVPLEAINEIVIPGLPMLTLEQRGVPFANLWVYKDETTGEYDQDYVCIEPVEADPTGDFFGSPESMIKPGSSRKTVITIRIISR